MGRYYYGFRRVGQVQSELLPDVSAFGYLRRADLLGGDGFCEHVPRTGRCAGAWPLPFSAWAIFATGSDSCPGADCAHTWFLFTIRRPAVISTRPPSSPIPRHPAQTARRSPYFIVSLRYCDPHDRIAHRGIPGPTRLSLHRRRNRPLLPATGLQTARRRCSQSDW